MFRMALYVAGNDGQSRAISCLHLMANLVPLIEIIFYTSQHTGWKIEAITDKYLKAEMFLVCSVICFVTFAFQRNCLSSFLLLSCHLSSLFFFKCSECTWSWLTRADILSVTDADRQNSTYRVHAGVVQVSRCKVWLHFFPIRPFPIRPQVPL